MRDRLAWAAHNLSVISHLAAEAHEQLRLAVQELTPDDPVSPAGTAAARDVLSKAIHLLSLAGTAIDTLAVVDETPPLLAELDAANLPVEPLGHRYPYAQFDAWLERTRAALHAAFDADPDVDPGELLDQIVEDVLPLSPRDAVLLQHEHDEDLAGVPLRSLLEDGAGIDLMSIADVVGYHLVNRLHAALAPLAEAEALRRATPPPAEPETRQ